MAGEGDLWRFSFHTGGNLRPLAPGERCPVLFRDLGLAPLARLLRNELPRLAGPMTPLLYARSAAYVEPFTDYERTGRVVLLRSGALSCWHSGVPEVYVARATAPVDWGAVGVAPGDADFGALVRTIADLRTREELREELGGPRYDELLVSEHARLQVLLDELEETETVAEPIRRRLQCARSDDRKRARDALQAADLSEVDLCTAWHHLPRSRRTALREALPRIGRELGVPGSMH